MERCWEVSWLSKWHSVWGTEGYTAWLGIAAACTQQGERLPHKQHIALRELTGWYLTLVNVSGNWRYSPYFSLWDKDILHHMPPPPLGRVSPPLSRVEASQAPSSTPQTVHFTVWGELKRGWCSCTDPEKRALSQILEMSLSKRWPPKPWEFLKATTIPKWLFRRPLDSQEYPRAKAANSKLGNCPQLNMMIHLKHIEVKFILLSPN